MMHCYFFDKGILNVTSNQILKWMYFKKKQKAKRQWDQGDS